VVKHACAWQRDGRTGLDALVSATWKK